MLAPPRRNPIACCPNAGPPPDPDTVEAAKPKDVRNINAVVNQANPGVAMYEERQRTFAKRPRYLGYGGHHHSNGREHSAPMGLPAPESIGGGWGDGAPSTSGPQFPSPFYPAPPAGMPPPGMPPPGMPHMQGECTGELNGD